MDKKNAIRFENILNQNTVKVYTDGSKLDGRIGADFYAEYLNNFPKQAFFTLEFTALCSRQKSYLVQKWQKNLQLEKMHNQSIVALECCAVKQLPKRS